MVSFKEIANHYNLHRWRLERPASTRLLGVLVRLAGSSLRESDRACAANVAWAVASLERAYSFLVANLGRAEDASNVGVPPIMAYLTGPYKISLDHLLATSLWMDLAEVLVCYRTVIERIGKLKGPARRCRLSVTTSEIDQLVDQLNREVITQMSAEPVRELANTVLHHSWHPDRTGRKVDLTLAFLGQRPNIEVDFTQGGFRDALHQLVVRTVEDTVALVERATQERHTQPS